MMNAVPPHITELVRGHKNINTAMGYKAVRPEEAIHSHQAFTTHRRGVQAMDVRQAGQLR